MKKIKDVVVSHYKHQYVNLTLSQNQMSEHHLETKSLQPLFCQCNKKRNFLTAEKSRFIRNQVSGFDTKTL